MVSDSTCFRGGREAFSDAGGFGGVSKKRHAAATKVAIGKGSVMGAIQYSPPNREITTFGQPENRYIEHIQKVIAVPMKSPVKTPNGPKVVRSAKSSSKPPAIGPRAR